MCEYEVPSIALLDEFRQHLFNQGLRSSTIASYLRDVAHFNRYLVQCDETQVIPPTRLHVNRFRTHLLAERYKATTINKKLNSLASYSLFLQEKRLLHAPIVHPKRDRISIVRGSERRVDVFTEAELSQLLFFVQRRQVPLRNRVIVETLLYTGVRCSELCALRLADLDLLTSTVRVLGKGDRFREIPLRPELADSLTRYIHGERKDSRFANSPYLLVSQRAPKLHRDAVNRLLRKMGAELGLEVWPHKFRHTFCSLLIRKGVALTTVSTLAGHSSVETTSTFYVNTAREQKIDAISLL